METMGSDMKRALNEMSEEMVKKLEQPTRRYVKNVRAVLRTPADIYEYPSSYSFIIDMPGLQATNIKVKVENGVLHVSGKKKNIKKSEESGNEVAKPKPIRIERRRARYMRKFTLPSDADPDDVKATYRDGVLTIDVAKKKESSKPKTISVPIS